ncbi:MAG: thiolase family protein [Proteobacteria bacterium]|nr:thiolase family protein [Pseudomonadota bacterium]
MEDVFVIGIHGTPTGRFANKGLKQLVREAYLGVLADGKLETTAAIGGIWFSNLLMDYWGQPYVKGQVCCSELMREGQLPAGVPIVNVEGGCASASIAFNGAYKEILSGSSQVALALGVEKMFDPARPGEILKCIERGTDQIDPESWHTLYRDIGAEFGYSFEPGADRSVAMDIYGFWANSHMSRYGTTAAQIAAAAAKNHCNSVDNPRAQYRFPLTVEKVLTDRMVSKPLTRAMCAPVGDAAAAAILCSREYLKTCSPEVRDRALRVRAQALAGGLYAGGWEAERAPVRAARKAYSMARIKPSDLDLVELHDASSFAEIHLIEDLGLCPRGQGGPFTASGATGRGGEIPVNLSGGLVSRGHPIGATGLLMLNEIAIQLRGEAGALQLEQPCLGLVENGGGIVGNDIAVCAVTILERP